MKIAVAADHGGFSLKEEIKKHLERKGIEVRDFGAASVEKTDDYPDYAIPAARSVASGECEAGILICTTGIGMSIAANKVPKVRAALVMNEEFARTARSHNHANVIALPGAGQISRQEALKIVDVYLEAKEEGGRHDRRVKKLEEARQ